MPAKYIKLIGPLAAAAFVANAIAQSDHERHPHGFARDVDALHAVLAPLWHARAGKERSENVCAQAPGLEGLARDIRSGDATVLVTSIVALKAQCQASPTDIDAAFARVHDAFHHLAEPGRH